MLLWVLGPVLNVVFAAQQMPRATVESFHATLLVAMQNAVELAFTGRRDLMAPSVSESFDLSFISEVVAGRLGFGKSACGQTRRARRWHSNLG